MKTFVISKVIIKSEGYTFRNIGMLVKVALPWLLVYSGFTFLFQILGIEKYLDLKEKVNYVTRYPKLAKEKGYDTIQNVQFALDAEGAQLGSAVILHQIFEPLLLLAAFSSIAVIWFRGYLMGEQPPKFRFGRLELKFLAYMALFVVIFGSIYYLCTNFLLNLNILDSLTGLTFLISSFLAVLLPLRFLLVFAGLSIGDKRMNPLKSWQVTRGNSWRIYGGSLAIMLVSTPTLFRLVKR